MPAFSLTHFSACLLFALFTSIVFGITQRAQPRMMVRLGLFTFAILVGTVIAASWVMWAIKH
jgi:type VI protein secretion system component VasK